MPKFVDVELNEISADFFPPDPDRRVQLRGRVFGTTFNKDPFEQKQLKDIFMFPEGPIEIAHGQTEDQRRGGAVRCVYSEHGTPKAQRPVAEIRRRIGQFW